MALLSVIAVLAGLVAAPAATAAEAGSGPASTVDGSSGTTTTTLEEPSSAAAGDGPQDDGGSATTPTTTAPATTSTTTAPGTTGPVAPTTTTTTAAPAPAAPPPAAEPPLDDDPAVPTATTGPEPIPDDLWDVEPTVGDQQSFVAMDGQPGDSVSRGRDHLYTKADALIDVRLENGAVAVDVNGYERWSGRFAPAEGQVLTSAEGYYPSVTRHPFHDPAHGGISWSGEGKACNTLTGWLAIDEITIVDGQLQTLTLRFFQTCFGDVGMFGKVHWDATDPTVPPGPTPIPDDLWDTAPAVAPGQSYLAIDGQSGDFISDGRDFLFTKADARLGVVLAPSALEAKIEAEALWRLSFVPMVGVEPTRSGFYAIRTGATGRNPAVGTLDLSGQSHSCSNMSGWVALDEITVVQGSVRTLTMRFFQSCNGGPGAYGKFHWDASDPTMPPGPAPVPEGLWDAPAPEGVTGSYVVMEGGQGDWVSAGGSYAYSKADAMLDVRVESGRIVTGVVGDESWSGQFESMDAHPIQEGFYTDVGSATSHNPTKGGLKWSGEGRGCSRITGWFAIDELVRRNGLVERVTLRFAQSCEGAPALYGKVHWEADDPTVPPGPGPVPDGLWDADPGVVGSYVYLDGTTGDWVSQGRDRLYTEGAHDISIVDQSGRARVSIAGQDWWYGDFSPMTVLDRLEVGFYPDLQRYPFNNPVKGGLSWYGNGRGCNELTGWFAVDRVEYAFGVLEELSLRFEQRCDGGPPMHGKVVLDPTPEPPRAPIGFLDEVVPRPGAVDVLGWSIDPDTRKPIVVHVYVDGVGAWLVADRSRPDVGAAYDGYGDAHGYKATLAAGPGAHQVCAYGIDTGGGPNTLLGCRTVVVPGGPPFGFLDAAYQSSSAIAVQGWVIDPDTVAPASVDIEVDGVSRRLRADWSRPDVGAAYPDYGARHGYSGTVPVGPGRHQVCAHGVDTSTGTRTLLGCRTVVVISGPPIGFLDAARPVPGGVEVQGWSIDPDSSTPIDVHVYVDGAGYALFASRYRPDVGTAFPGYGHPHGYEATLPAAPGRHRVCAYGIDSAGGTNSLLGCKDVVVPAV